MTVERLYVRFISCIFLYVLWDVIMLQLRSELRRLSVINVKSGRDLIFFHLTSRGCPVWHICVDNYYNYAAKYILISNELVDYNNSIIIGMT